MLNGYYDVPSQASTTPANTVNGVLTAQKQTIVRVFVADYPLSALQHKPPCHQEVMETLTSLDSQCACYAGLL